MLPPLNEDGNLPFGIYRASIEEVIDRFGYDSAERQVEARELFEFVAWARQHGAARLIVNGSFVTDKPQPNDVDVVVLPLTSDGSPNAMGEFDPSTWPFLQVFIAADEPDLLLWATGDFGTDREGRSKGVVEVILWPST